jgi:hypothetical protein
LVISDAYEDWFPFACHENFFFLENVDASFVNTKTVLSSDVLPTLISNVEKSWN